MTEPRSAAEARDRLGAALGFRAAANGQGIWWGACRWCQAPKASVAVTGYSCTRCETALTLDDLEAQLAASTSGPRKLPAPMGVADLLAVEDPVEEWLVEGLIPEGGNVLLAGYPKTYKPMVLLELAVALATATPFLGGYRVPTKRRAGIVLMEDMAHRVRRRLQRLCLGRGIELADLEGWIHVWCRPPLRLTDATVGELASDAASLELDYLAVDSWAYVASGDSNSADEVTPQLMALSACRARRPGLTVQLTHHARKTPGDGSGDRLTDLIRNSGAFGAWYDSGIVLGRRDETSPVTVRAELRDHESPPPFAFVVEDQHPGSADNGRRSSGWIRLTASEDTPQALERRAAAEQLVPAVRDHLAAHPDGVSRTGLREVPGKHLDVEAAFHLLVEMGEAVYTPAPGPGKPANYALKRDPAQPCPNPARAGSEEDPAHPAPDRPVKAGVRGQGSEARSNGQPRPGSGAGSTAQLSACTDCGAEVPHDPSFDVLRCQPCAMRAGREARA